VPRNYDDEIRFLEYWLENPQCFVEGGIATEHEIDMHIF